MSEKALNNSIIGKLLKFSNLFIIYPMLTAPSGVPQNTLLIKYRSYRKYRLISAENNNTTIIVEINNHPFSLSDSFDVTTKNTKNAKNVAAALILNAYTGASKLVATVKLLEFRKLFNSKVGGTKKL